MSSRLNLVNYKEVERAFICCVAGHVKKPEIGSASVILQVFFLGNMHYVSKSLF